MTVFLSGIILLIILNRIVRNKVKILDKRDIDIVFLFITIIFVTIQIYLKLKNTFQFDKKYAYQAYEEHISSPKINDLYGYECDGIVSIDGKSLWFKFKTTESVALKNLNDFTKTTNKDSINIFKNRLKNLKIGDKQFLIEKDSIISAFILSNSDCEIYLLKGNYAYFVKSDK